MVGIKGRRVSPGLFSMSAVGVSRIEPLAEKCTEEVVEKFVTTIPSILSQMLEDIVERGRVVEYRVSKKDFLTLLLENSGGTATAPRREGTHPNSSPTSGR